MRGVVGLPLVRSNVDDSLTLLPDGKIQCKLCPYVTDKKANWYKHKKKHMGNYILHIVPTMQLCIEGIYNIFN